MRHLARKLTLSELRDPSGLNPKIRQLQKKLLQAIRATHSTSLNQLLIYMNLPAFERELVIQNFDVLLESLEKELKKSHRDYFGWAILFAWLHYRRERDILKVIPEEDAEGKVTYKPTSHKMEMPPLDPELQRIYNERVDNLMSSVRTELHDGVLMDVDNARINGWSSKHLNEELEKRFMRAENRAKTIAVTEMQFAYNSFIVVQAQKDGFDLQVVTALDERVCPICGPEHGKIYHSDSLPYSLPRHTNCRCVWKIILRK